MSKSSDKPKIIKFLKGLIGLMIIWFGFVFFQVIKESIYSQTYYLDQDINEIEYAEPTEEAKNFNIEEYIKNLPPVEYTKIDYPVKETLTYKFNGYVLTMDIPEGYEYEIIPRNEEDNRVQDSRKVPEIYDNLDYERYLTRGWLYPLVSDNRVCIENEKTESFEDNRLCIIPNKSSHKKLSMRDFYVTNMKKSWKKKYSFNSKFYLETNLGIKDFEDDKYYSYRIDYLLSDQQQVSFSKAKNMSKDLFLNIINTVQIKKLDSK